MPRSLRRFAAAVDAAALLAPDHGLLRAQGPHDVPPLQYDVPQRRARGLPYAHDADALAAFCAALKDAMCACCVGTHAPLMRASRVVTM